MKLPNCKNVFIPKEKLSGYILSLTNPEGKSKAKLFREWGFDETNIVQLEEALRKIAIRRKVIISRPSNDSSGINYEVDGKITIPNGGTRSIKTVWYIEKDQRYPRFVTAYPLR